MGTLYIENNTYLTGDDQKSSPFGCFVKAEKAKKKQKKSLPRRFFNSILPKKAPKLASIPTTSGYTSTCSIDDLSDAILTRVFENLENPRDRLRIGQTCQRFRFIVEKRMTLKPVPVNNRELFYRYNFHHDHTEVYAMKIGRSIAGTSKRPRNWSSQRSVDSASSAGSLMDPVKMDGLRGDSLTELLVPGIVFTGTIIFEPNIDLMAALTEIYDLFKVGILRPRVLRFHGGTSGSRSCSPLPEVVAMQQRRHQRQAPHAFDEADFVAFVREMGVCVREVHLMNSKHLIFAKKPISLLYLVDSLDQFSLMTSDPSVPTIQYSLNDIFAAAAYWQHLPPPENNCVFNIREPTVGSQSGSIHEVEPSEVLFDHDQRLTAIAFTHPSDPDITLTYNFH
uniref:F-box domain-containing protein n=1 Tax=Panagrellus redivivus TaxID=6233 RepID=A0A7E4ZQT1_PANRE